MRKHLLGMTGLFAMVCISMPFSSPLAMTLEEAVAQAIKSHPKVLGANKAAKAADSEISVQRSGFLPSIDFKTAGGSEYVNNSTTRSRAERNTGDPDKNSGVGTVHKEGSVTFVQPVFDGLAAWYGTDSAQRMAASAQFQLLDARDSIALRAVQSFLEVMRTRELMRLTEENVKHHLSTLDKIRDKAEQGAASNADVQQAINRLTGARTRQVQTKGAVRDAESKFFEAIGTAPEALEEPSKGADVPEELVTVLTEALRNNPTLKAAKEAFESRSSDVGAARSTYWPTLSLEATATRKDDVGGIKGPVMENSILLVGRYNMFKGGRDIARVSKAIEQKHQALEKEAEVRRQLEQQTKLDFSAFEVARDSAPIFEEKVGAATEVLSAYSQQFDLGRRSLLDLLDAEDDLYSAKVSLLNAEFGLMDAKHRILADMGVLLTAFNLPRDGEEEK